LHFIVFVRHILLSIPPVLIESTERTGKRRARSEMTKQPKLAE
jgi:hypothetical protein